MYTVYKGEEYRFSECFVYNGKFVSGICTKNIEKADDSFVFCKEGNIYLKFLERAELSDLYDVRFSAEYNTEIEDLRREWDIVGRGQIDSEHKRIVLVNYDDIPSGWNVLEKGVGSKYVDISEFSNFKIVYVYFKKDGVECSTPVIEKKAIEYTDDDEIIKKLLAGFDYYRQI